MVRTYHYVFTMARPIQIDSKLSALRKFYRLEKRMPSFAEMMALFNYRSKSPVTALMTKLVASGHVRRDGRKLAATPKLTTVIVSAGEIITAGPGGYPSPADEELVDVMSLDDWLVRKPGATFMLRVTGDSMTGAGIMPGDVVLVERNTNPKTGSIVVAEVDGDWMIKYLVRDKAGVALESANPKYKTIRPRQTLVICGMVVSQCRKYV